MPINRKTQVKWESAPAAVGMIPDCGRGLIIKRTFKRLQTMALDLYGKQYYTFGKSRIEKMSCLDFRRNYYE